MISPSLSPDDAFRIERDDHWRDTPLLSAAVHDGHHLRAETAALIALDDGGQLREEDPFTAEMAQFAPTRIVGLRSRFEVDLNRARDKAVYQKPEDAWGLEVWQDELPAEIVARSLEQYDAFYREVEKLLSDYARQFGKFVVFDLHSYNHRRDGADSPEANREENPEVNIGTGSLDRARWAPVVDALIAALRAHDFAGRQLDVRENVKFGGGEFPRWVHRRFPESACAIAIEWKKFWMDEWSGQENRAQLEQIKAALVACVPHVVAALNEVD